MCGGDGATMMPRLDALTRRASGGAGLTTACATWRLTIVRPSPAASRLPPFALLAAAGEARRSSAASATADGASGRIPRPSRHHGKCRDRSRFRGCTVGRDVARSIITSPPTPTYPAHVAAIATRPRGRGPARRHTGPRPGRPPGRPPPIPVRQRSAVGAVAFGASSSRSRRVRTGDGRMRASGTRRRCRPRHIVRYQRVHDLAAARSPGDSAPGRPWLPDPSPVGAAALLVGGRWARAGRRQGAFLCAGCIVLLLWDRADMHALWFALAYLC